MNMTNSLLFAAAGTTFTFFMTCLGAAVVLLFKNSCAGKSQKVFLGFASGVMIAASVWSLLIPSIERSQEFGIPGYIPAAGGFILGVIFLLVFDKLINVLAIKKNGNQNHQRRSTSLLISAITLHNIPEGMAVGLSFAIAAQNGGDAMDFAPAIALALGIGIQNFPEGAAVSLPLLNEGKGKLRAFADGCLSGVVEPIFGILTVVISASVAFYLPWLLSFAAGAMMFAVIKELIPDACSSETKTCGTLGAMVGFLIMMVLDVALG